MAEQTTLARPYARAAFSCAVDAGLEEDWAQALTQLAAAAGFVTQRLNSPMPAAAKIELLLALAELKPDERLSNLLTLLADKRRLTLLPDIARLFRRLLERRREAVEVEIVVARDTDAEALDKIGAALEKKLRRRLEVRSRIDEALIGGAVVRVGDAITDGSLRGRLRGLAAAVR